nr:RNA-directed DNA polymerase, eukaryota [Tanacetum cinerariifolium]
MVQRPLPLPLYCRDESGRKQTLKRVEEKGGLGVSSLFALNRALMFKWVWRFFNQSDSLWVRAFMIYLDLMAGLVEPEMSDIRLFGAILLKKWIVGSSFGRLEGAMLNPSEDRWSWDLNGSGEFSVASARRYIDNNRLPDISSKTRWIKEVPIKVNVHAWKVRINGLETRWNISRRGIDIPSILCPLCEMGVESSKHLFFNCSVVRAIFRRVCIWWDVSYMALDSFNEWISWIINLRLPSKHKSVESSKHLFFNCSVVRAIFRRVCIWWDVSYMALDSFDEWISWITNLRLPSKHKSILEGVCYGLWWFIWAFRNKKIFGVVPSSKANIFDDLVISSFFWCRFRCKATFSWVDWLKNPYIVSL